MDASQVFEMPHAVSVAGVTVRANHFGVVLRDGTDFDRDVRLNKDTDVLIATYPRTGTTWLIQIVSLLRAGDKYDEVSKTSIAQRHQFMEQARDDQPPGRDVFVTTPAPRIAKTHLPYEFVNRWVERDGVRTIITLRNPKDTLVSLFHFYRSNKAFGFSGTWDEFFAHVKAEKQIYGTQLNWTTSWWRQRSDENLLIVQYEDMVTDTETQITKIADFLDLTLTQETLQKVLHDSAFKAMQTNSATNYSDSKLFDFSKGNFIRSGKIGGWKDYFSVAQNEWFDHKYGKIFDDLGIEFQYQ